VAVLIFESFLARYQLSMLDVGGAAACVCRITVWRVMRSLPVTEQQAVQVYASLHRLYGVPYRGRISPVRRGTTKLAFNHVGPYPDMVPGG